VDRTGDEIEGQGLLFEVGVGVDGKVVRVLAEAEKAEALGQFHDGAGLGLGRTGTLAHLLLIADHFLGILAAYAEKDGNVQTAVVDPLGMSQDIELRALQPAFKSGHGLLRRHDLVLVVGGGLVGVLQRDFDMLHGFESLLS
jgi:hypothetical protein